MGTLSPNDMMARVSESIQQRTGKTLEEWVTAVLESGLDPLDQNSVRKWLKSEHGIAQNTHWAIADAAARAAGWVRPSPDGYIDSQYQDKKAPLRPIFDAIHAAILSIDPLVTVEGRGGYTPFGTIGSFARWKLNLNWSTWVCASKQPRNHSACLKAKLRANVPTKSN